MIDAVNPIYRAEGILGQSQVTDHVFKPGARIAIANLVEPGKIAAGTNKTSNVKLAMSEQTFDDRASQKAGGSGDEYLHWFAICALPTCRTTSSTTLAVRRISQYGMGTGSSFRMLS